jgi:polyhydroxyalkanoate synthesis regulator phasin
MSEKEIKSLYKIVDKLEQRISALEKKVLDSWRVKGQLRKGESKDPYINLMEKGENKQVKWKWNYT